MRRPRDSYVITSNNKAETFLILLSSAAIISRSVSFPVQNLTKIKKISIQCLSCVKFTAESSKFFRNFDRLEELRVNGLCAESDAISVIADALPKSLSSLKVLDLSNCQLDSSNAIALLSSCKEVPSLAQLNLSNNRIADDSIHSVIESLLQVSKLSKVCMDGNLLRKSNVLAISFITSNFNPGTSTIDYNMPESEAFHTLLSSAVSIGKGRSHQVENIKKINSLILHFAKPCEMSEEFSRFFMKFEALSILKIHGIRIKSVAISNISKALSHKINSLRELYLNHCSLQDDGVRELTNGLENCKNLHILDLAYNSITDEATEALKNIAKHLYQHSLKEININNNYLNLTNEKNIKYEVSSSCIIA